MIMIIMIIIMIIQSIMIIMMILLLIITGQLRRVAGQPGGAGRSPGHPEPLPEREGA